MVLLQLLFSAPFGFDFDDEEEATQQAAFFSDDGTSVEIQHAFGAGPWKPRGKLVYRDAPSSGPGVMRATARALQGKLSGDDLDAFQALVAEGGYYRLRVPAVLNEPESTSYVIASASACALAASRFQEELQLSMSARGQVLGLSYLLPVVPPRCPTTGLPKIALDEQLFNTTVSVRFPAEGVRPLGKAHDASLLPAPAAAAVAAAAKANPNDPDAKQARAAPHARPRSPCSPLTPRALLFHAGAAAVLPPQVLDVHPARRLDAHARRRPRARGGRQGGRRRRRRRWRRRRRRRRRAPRGRSHPPQVRAVAPRESGSAVRKILLY